MEDLLNWMQHPMAIPLKECEVKIEKGHMVAEQKSCKNKIIIHKLLKT